MVSFVRVPTAADDFSLCTDVFSEIELSIARPIWKMSYPMALRNKAKRRPISRDQDSVQSKCITMNGVGGVSWRYEQMRRMKNERIFFSCLDVTSECGGGGTSSDST